MQDLFFHLLILVLHQHKLNIFGFWNGSWEKIEKKRQKVPPSAIFSLFSDI